MDALLLRSSPSWPLDLTLHHPIYIIIIYTFTSLSPSPSIHSIVIARHSLPQSFNVFLSWFVEFQTSRGSDLVLLLPRSSRDSSSSSLGNDHLFLPYKSSFFFFFRARGRESLVRVTSEGSGAQGCLNRPRVGGRPRPDRLDHRLGSLSSALSAPVFISKSRTYGRPGCGGCNPVGIAPVSGPGCPGALSTSKAYTCHS